MSSVPGASASAPDIPADRPKAQLNAGNHKNRTARPHAPGTIRARRVERHQEQTRSAVETLLRTERAREQQAAAAGDSPELTDAQRETAHTDFRARLRAVKAAGSSHRAYTRRRAAEDTQGPETALSGRQNPSESVDAETADPNSPRRLGTTENSVSAAGQERGSWAVAEDSIGARYEQRNCKLTKRMRLLDEARAFTTLTSLRACGAMPLAGAVAVKLKDNGDGSFEGVARCGSVWSCPECAPIVRAERAANLERQAAAWMNAGYGLAMATLTTRHWEHARLKPQLDGVAGSWRKLIAGSWWAGRHVIRDGRPAVWGPEWEGDPEYIRTEAGTVWKRGFRQKHGIVGVTRALEMTHSWSSSWHAHIHAVLWFEDRIDAEKARRVENELFARWRHLLTRAGLGKPVQPYGVRVDPARGEVHAGKVAKYLVKVQDKDTLDEDQEDEDLDVDGPDGTPLALRRKGKKTAARALGNEMLRGDMKTGRKEPGRVPGRSTFEILRRAAAGDEAELQLWLEYEQATKGHRMLTWSGDIKARLAELVDVDERDDQEIVADEDRKGGVLVGVEAQPWKQTVAAVPGRRGRIRGAVKKTYAKALETGQDPEGACREVVISLLEAWGLVRGTHILDAVTTIERQERARAARWQTADELDAGTHILGITPRDAVRPEQAARRAKGLPIAREAAALPKQDSTPKVHSGPCCTVCGDVVDPRLSFRHILCGR